MNILDAKLTELAARGFDACSFTVAEADTFLGQEAEPWALDAHIERPLAGCGSTPVCIQLRGSANGIRRLGVALILSGLSTASAQVLGALRDGNHLALMRWPYPRRVSYTGFTVFSLEYSFEAQREDDTPETIFLDHHNPFFGFVLRDQFHAYLDGIPAPDVQSTVLISGGEQARLRLGRMLLDLAHPRSMMGGEFSLERRRFEVSAGLNSCNAHFSLDF